MAPDSMMAPRKRVVAIDELDMVELEDIAILDMVAFEESVMFEPFEPTRAGLR